MESRIATYIETLQHLLPPPTKLSPLQDLALSSWDIDDDTLDNDYILYDGLVRDVRDYIGVLDFTANAPANHEDAIDVSADPQVQELVNQIRDLTRRDSLTSAARSPGAASLEEESLLEAVREPLSMGASPPSGGGASQETEGFSPAPIPPTVRREAAMRSNMIHRASVVTLRAVTELTGAVTRYRGVRQNKKNDDDINNNNHAALVELFQPSTLHKLRQLGLYTNTEADTAHQLDAEAVTAEVAYTMTNTQPSCSGGGESDRVPNTFKEAMGLPEAAR